MVSLMLTWLDEHTAFPPTASAWAHDTSAPGLLAASEHLSLERLRTAYAKGIFPWYSAGQPVLWWTPDPRMVLPVQSLRLSSSLRKQLRRFIRNPLCEIRIDSDFEAVIAGCAQRPGSPRHNTWIVSEMAQAYTAWHRAGQVHSVETWINGELVGGLYCVNLGRMVFGESMFSRRTDASKIALAALVAWCISHDITLIDCQQHTAHLASLGAREVPRSVFESHLQRTVDAPSPGTWTYDASMWKALPWDRIPESPN